MIKRLDSHCGIARKRFSDSPVNWVMRQLISQNVSKLQPLVLRIITKTKCYFAVKISYVYVGVGKSPLRDTTDPSSRVVENMW